MASQQVEEGKTATRPADPVLEGYEFAGWYLKTTTNTLKMFC
ncbi:MAG: InlB B-repeat-containing protein [Intestinibacter sp.]